MASQVLKSVGVTLALFHFSEAWRTCVCINSAFMSVHSCVYSVHTVRVLPVADVGRVSFSEALGEHCSHGGCRNQ